MSATEDTTMEATTPEATMMNVVLMKKPQPKSDPYRNCEREIRVWVRVVAV